MANVYLAGPGVFRPDADDFGRSLKEKCARVGLVGCFPLDNTIEAGTPAATARAIYRANVDLIEASHAVIADISSFRGPNMDPGTAWEIGYAVARGLPVYVWTPESAGLFERTERQAGAVGSIEKGRDQNGWIIENFGLMENLMIMSSAISVHPSADDAILACAASLSGERSSS